MFWALLGAADSEPYPLPLLPLSWIGPCHANLGIPLIRLLPPPPFVTKMTRGTSANRSTCVTGASGDLRGDPTLRLLIFHVKREKFSRGGVDCGNQLFYPSGGSPVAWIRSCFRDFLSRAEAFLEPHLRFRARVVRRRHTENVATNLVRWSVSFESFSKVLRRRNMYT